LSGLDYRSVGVDIAAADAAKERIRRIVESTFTAETRGAFGQFAALSSLPAGMRAPLLVASADGVGSKLKVAVAANRHDTIGKDLVNHCVNDILTQGARPLFMLDYVALGEANDLLLERIVTGIAEGCRENGCALIGGETAILPELYTPPDYDLAGFIVGAVEEDWQLGPHRVEPNDVLIALPSSGLHTNGYTLARRIVEDRLRLRPSDPFPGTKASVADVLLTVHRSYYRLLWPLLKHVHSLAHITGGGLPGNLSRAIPSHLNAVVETTSWIVPQQFTRLQEAGQITVEEMFRTFNMGVGMVAVTPAAAAERVLQDLHANGCEAWRVGGLERGNGAVRLV
jgi:phosphoribosylformylglycinamidine cyclo-ligase